MVVAWSHDGVPDVLRCSSGTPHACAGTGWTRMRFDARTGTLLDVGPGGGHRSCPCYVPADEDDADAADASGDGEGDCQGGGVPPSVVSLAGGTLFALGGESDNDGCSGAHVIDSTGWVQPLVRHAARAPSGVRGTCYEGLPRDAGWPVASLHAVDCAATAAPDQDCDACAQQTGDEAGALFERHGQLARVGTNEGVSWKLTFVQTSPLDPGHCPAAGDPCGDPAGFPGIDAYPEHWIATDGSAALVANDHVRGVLARGATTPKPVDFNPAVVIGVRYHADLRSLLARMGAGWPDDDAICATQAAPGCRASRAGGGVTARGRVTPEHPPPLRPR